MSGISSIPSLPMTVSNAALLKRVSGPATARNMAKTAYQDKVNGTEQAAASGQSAATYWRSALQSSKASYTPETANAAAAKGTPTHGFFFHDLDAMARSAADPEQEPDVSAFVKDTLDFFTGGDYTEKDAKDFQGQVVTALREVASQLSETGSLDTGRLKSRMNVGGAEVSLSQLAQFQTAGRQLSPAFDGISAENTRHQDMQAAANMAVARAMSQKVGRGQGEIGALFGAAMDRLYERGMGKIDQLYADAPEGLSGSSAASRNAAGLRGQVADMFSGLDTSNKSAMGKDFGRKLSVMKAMMNQQDRQFGVPPGFQSASMAARNVGLYFATLSRMI